MERSEYPIFGDKYAEARFPERVRDMDMVKRGKVFEFMLGREGKCIYTPNFFVVTEVNLETETPSCQIKGFTFHDTYSRYMSGGISGYNLSDLGIGSNSSKRSSYLLETDFPNVPEELLKTIEAEIIEVGTLRHEYEVRNSRMLGDFQALYINRIPKVI